MEIKSKSGRPKIAFFSIPFYSRRTVAAVGLNGPFGPVCFDDLTIINITAKPTFDCINVNGQAIRRNLQLGSSSGQLRRVRTSVATATSRYLTTSKGRDKFRVRVHSTEGPSISILRVAIRLNVLILVADESPHLIHLDPAAIEIPHLGIHASHAAFSNAHAKSHDCVPVDAHRALDGADTRTFAQRADDPNPLVSAEYVRHAVIVIRKD